MLNILNKIGSVYLLLFVISINNISLANDLIASKVSPVTLGTNFESIKRVETVKNNKKLLQAVTDIQINSSVNDVVKALTDFNNYPKIFPNIQSHKVIKQDNNFVLTERFLKPMFIYKQTKHNVIYNLSKCPTELTWVIMSNNNVNYASGQWLIEAVNPSLTKVTYSIKVIPHNMLAPGFGNMVLNFIQSDAVKSLKKYCEAS